MATRRMKESVIFPSLYDKDAQFTQNTTYYVQIIGASVEEQCL